MSILGVSSLSAWTAWKTQQLLIDSNKELALSLAQRLPEDVALYDDMLTQPEAMQKAIDNRSLAGLLVVIVDQQGTVLQPAMADPQLLPHTHSFLEHSQDQPGWESQVLVLEDRAVVICKGGLVVDGQPLGMLYVIRDITTERMMFLSILRNLGIAAVVIVGAMTLALAEYVRRSLQPLKQVRQMTRNVCPETIGDVKLRLDAAPTEVNDLAETCDDMLDRLSMTWEQQRQFVNDVSHELRTPLTIVSGYLQSTLRRSKTLTEPQREALEIAAAEANRTIQLLENLLELARAHSGSLHYATEPILLNEFVMEVATMVQTGSDRTLTIEVEGGPEGDRPIYVLGDRNRLKQVIMNLVDNALKYSEAPSPVILHITCQNQQAAIAVQDFGCGIPLTHQSRIFDRFYRVDETRCRATGGCGLGLSIVKALTEGMGGRVSLSSKPDRGSTFTVMLPLAPPQP